MKSNPPYNYLKHCKVTEFTIIARKYLPGLAMVEITPAHRRWEIVTILPIGEIRNREIIINIIKAGRRANEGGRL